MSWGEDKMKVFTERLLVALEYEEVREKLRAVLAADSQAPAAVSDAKEKEPRWIPGEQKTKEVAGQVRQSYEKALEEAKRQISQLQAEKAGLSRERDRLSQQCKKLQDQLVEVRNAQQRDRDAYKRNYQQVLYEAEKKQADYEAQCQQQKHQVVAWKEKLERLNAVSAPFEETLSMYEKVQSLSPQVKKRVQAYFKSQTPVSFLVCAGQENNLFSLWDIIKEEMDSCKAADKSILLALLSYSIGRVNDSYDTSRFALRQDQVGDRFDDRVHSRSKESSVYSGPITEVILPGIVQVNTGRAMRQSVVRV